MAAGRCARRDEKDARNREGTREDPASFAFLYVAVATGIIGPLVVAATVRGAAITFARWPIFIVGVAGMASGPVTRAWAVVLLVDSSRTMCGCIPGKRFSTSALTGGCGTPPTGG